MSTDPRAKRYTIPCTYLGLYGKCNRPCFRGVCSRHRARKSLPPCRNCGVRGTTAPHGYCSQLENGCVWKAQYWSKVAKTERDAMDALIDDILSWDWRTTHVDQCPRTITTLAGAECVRSG
jgi:hypothetical protein